MKSIVTLALLAIAAVSNADEIEPAVATSSAAVAPPAAVPAAAAAAAAPRAAAKGAAPARQSVGQKSTAHDQIELDTTQITGNRELPNVMYVVPWKRPDLGDFAGRPAKSLLDELLAPVDRDVFRRQNRYFAALQAEPAARSATPVVAPAPGAVITLPVGDEK